MKCDSTIPKARPAAIEYRQPGGAPLLPLLVVSVLLHILLALGVTFILSRHLKEQPPTVDPGIDVTFALATGEGPPPGSTSDPSRGSPPKESLTSDPKDSQSDAPKEPPPPQPADATSTVLPPQTPPTEAPERPEAKTKQQVKAEPEKVAARKLPTETKRDQPRPKTSSGTTTPGTRSGDPSTRGLDGGVSNGTKTDGIPGSGKGAGWSTPKPDYPRAALVARVSGKVTVRIETDGTGRVRQVTVTGSTGTVLDENTCSYARRKWTGPPNSTKTIPVIYRLP
jgi:TonB family protein